MNDLYKNIFLGFFFYCVSTFVSWGRDGQRQAQGDRQKEICSVEALRKFLIPLG